MNTLFEWLKGLFARGQPTDSESFSLGGELMPTVSAFGSELNILFVRQLAFVAAIELIANAISKCEFETFEQGKEVKKEAWYRWNIEPNVNENSSEFLQKLITKLYSDGRALVIKASLLLPNTQYVVADDYEVVRNDLYPDTYRNIRVGETMLASGFSERNVYHFELPADLKSLVDGLLCGVYGPLLKSSVDSFNRSHGVHGIFKYETLPLSGDSKKAFDDLIQKGITKWLKADNSVLPLGNGHNISEIKLGASENSRDFKALLMDAFELTGLAMGIPPVLLTGQVAGIAEIVSRFLTFCIDPLADMMSEEINRKDYGREVLNGTYLQINTNRINHFDILQSATAMDKLISSGVYCVNDIRELIGESPIDEPWANQHFVTKNYAPFDSALDNVT
ncbi:MAG: phage portal protein [Oscillospiraceae bacterium]|jgi:HK97 family phage portal protein|nr:phage portal protein [Oscillospiraceae bacterium]